MEAMKNSEQTWQHRLSSFLLAYCRTPHSVTVSPGSLFLQRELRTRLDLLRETTEQIVRKKQEEYKEWNDKNMREKELEPNNVVWARNYGVGERWVKGKIKQGLGPASYIVELVDGKMCFPKTYSSLTQLLLIRIHCHLLGHCHHSLRKLATRTSVACRLGHFVKMSVHVHYTGRHNYMYMQVL